MRNAILVAALVLSSLAFAQRSDGIRGTRVGGVRPDTIQRAQQKEDPEVKKEIVATSKETGINRGKLLNEFRATQQKLAEMANGPHGMAAAPIPATKVTFSAQDFHKAKVFSVQKKIPMDTVLNLTSKYGNLDKALNELQASAK